jgi:GT2 family glycosyltransferase/exopolysaccharide biosynthesis predicted pyruvyltransferase EpsI
MGVIGRVSDSRAALLETIGDHRELTLIRAGGNIGDELIRAGTHELLADRVFREIDIDELPQSSGDTVLLPGSGAFCRPYHEWMPRALAVAELRFDRVIVLPSSFDIGEDVVSAALKSTRATVFAREPASLRQIEGVCRARLAHDCAFFFDFSGWPDAGEGVLNAFRTDREAVPGELPLPDNRDISLTANGIDEWLAEIAGHALVRTDRLHVMIAAALMGKQVQYAPSSYHKLGSVAAWCLGDFPVSRIEHPRAGGAAHPVSPPAETARRRLRATAASTPPPSGDEDSEARVTVVVLTRDRPDLVIGAARSALRAAVALNVLIIDNNSAPCARDALVALAGSDPRIELRLAKRNLGAAGGRKLAAEIVDTEFVLFLDDDAELIDGALEHMLADLDGHPEAMGVTPVVVDAHCLVQHYGGCIAAGEDVARFELDGSGKSFEDPSLAPTGPSGWVPGTASLLRTQILREVGIDDGMAAYYEDNEWCYRVERRAPGRFRRCREALVLHHHDFKEVHISSSRLEERFETFERLEAQARFLEVTGVLLDVDLARMLPELRGTDGQIELNAVRLLLELIRARGVAWAVTEWMNGGLRQLLGPGFHTLAQSKQRISALEGEQAQDRERISVLEHERAQQLVAIGWLSDRNTTLERIERGGWWRLRSRLLPVLRAGAALRRRVGEHS